jgi:raffinose/stachyose/melibiose transport system permease protein
MVENKLNKPIISFVGIAVALFWLSPFYIMIVNSFKPKKEIFESTLALPKTFTFDNYVVAAKALNLSTSLLNSLLITVSTIVLVILFSSMAAYSLQRTKTKTSNFIFFMLISSMLIPFQAVMIPLVSFMAKLQLIGNRHGLIFMYIGFSCTMAVFLIHGTLQSISVSLDEAAKIDGCNAFQTFFIIILPLLKPILVTIAILNTIATWNDYLLPSLTLVGKGSDKLQTLPMKIFFFFGEYTKQWHLAMAGLTISVIPIIIFYFIAQKQILDGMTEGAVK